MKKLAIFDYDGTLIDSYLYAIRCINEILEKLNKEPITVLDTTFEETLQKLINRDDLSQEEFNTIMSYFSNHFFDYQKENNLPFKGMNELLLELQKNDILLAINSKKPEEQLIELNKIFFKNIDFIAVTGYNGIDVNKPNPKRILEIIKNLGLKKEEVIYIGDSISDIEAAKNAEIDIIFVSWGQSNEEVRSNEYIDFLVDTPSEILDIILNFKKNRKYYLNSFK